MELLAVLEEREDFADKRSLELRTEAGLCQRHFPLGERDWASIHSEVAHS
jgi:hypothetical protein